MDIIAREGLDRARGIAVQARKLAESAAAKIALLGGSVDIIVADWLWVARERASGENLVFVPFARVTGTLLVAKGQAIAGLSDLRGKRLGIAGGALDKNWLLLRAAAWRQLDGDLATLVEPVFAAPPLLNAELAAGRLDAVLTYWQYSALAEASGARVLLRIEDVLSQLGAGEDVPMLGFVMRESFASAHPDWVAKLAEASRAAKSELAKCDERWAELVRPIAGEDGLVRDLLCKEYRASVPRHWGTVEREQAASIFAALREIGGSDLVGEARSLDSATFWPGVVF